MNAYFPTDSQIANFDQTELLQVQNERENIMDTTEFDDVLLGGDFNYDKRRLSSFTISMDTFLERLGFKSVWEKFPIDFTNIHTDMKSTYILDNFFMNERLLDKVEDAGVLHFGDNRSRHSPIMLKLGIEHNLRANQMAYQNAHQTEHQRMQQMVHQRGHQMAHKRAHQMVDQRVHQ